MATTSNTDVNWFTVDTDTLPTTVKAKYQALQKAHALVKSAKEEFESTFLASARKMDKVDADVNLAFGYRFGKLAIAKVDKATVVKKDTKPKFTF
jgi:hypothetical protein